MNPSTQTVLDAVRKSGGETVFVLPNNGNIILAAQQAAELAADEGIQVFVVPTKTIQQGVSAMYAYEPGAAPEENQAAMLEASQGVHSLAVILRCPGCGIQREADEERADLGPG